MKSFRFLLNVFFPNYLFVLCLSLGLTGAAILTGAAYGGDGPFTSLVSGYYIMFPAILQLANLMAGLGYSTSTLNTALAMGTTRREYFRGVCALQLLNAGIFWLAQGVMICIPGWLNWAEDFLSAPVSTAFAPSAPLLILAYGWLGCALGGLYLKHRRLSGLVLGLLVCFSLMSTPFSIFGWINWGDLELVTCAASLLGIVLFAMGGKLKIMEGVVQV